jgi:ribulose-5-phosphate 4-epimerase/fuculose-1-phosphate aldolase
MPAGTESPTGYATPARAASGGDIRAQVAACTRLLNMLGVLHYSGHVSARVPGRDQLHIQTRTESRAEVTPDSILLVDFDGHVLEGSPGRPPSELVIHTGIYRARPDVGAIIHNHMPLAVALTMVRRSGTAGADVAGLEIMDFHAAHWAAGVPVMREVGHIKTEADGAALARALGGANALLLRAHGVVMVAESAPGILIDTVHFEDNLRAMKEALSFGGALEPLAAADYARVDTTEDRPHRVRKSWGYYLSKGYQAGILPGEWDLAL